MTVSVTVKSNVVPFGGFVSETQALAVTVNVPLVVPTVKGVNVTSVEFADAL